MPHQMERFSVLVLLSYLCSCIYLDRMLRRSSTVADTLPTRCTLEGSRRANGTPTPSQRTEEYTTCSPWRSATFTLRGNA